MKPATPALLFATLFLAACEDNWDPPPTPAPDLAVDVITITGNTHRLEGSYSTFCLADSNGDFEVINTFAGSRYKQEYLYYPSTDGSCSGGVARSEQWIGTITLFDEAAAIEGWMDGDGYLAPLPEANSGISIGPRAPYSALIQRDDAHYIDGVLVPPDPDASPSQLPGRRAWYLYYIVDDTRGGPVRLWEVFCEVLGDDLCKEYALQSSPFIKL